MIAYLCLGANLNDPETQIGTAISELEKRGVSVLRASPLERTAPYGKTDQPDFYNQSVEVSTELAPEALLALIHSIESDMGRIRSEKWGPRIIDIDIQLYEDIVMNTAELTIPHPDLPNREFALRQLTCLVPDYMHPVINKTIKEIYSDLQNNGGIR